MWLTLLVLALAFGLLLWWDYRNKGHSNEVLRRSKLDCDANLPILGGGTLVIGGNAEDIIERMRSVVLKKKNRTIVFWVLHQLVMFTADLKLMESILSSRIYITKNNVYDMLAAWLGNGLLLSTGQKWRERRQILKSCFGFKLLQEFCNIFDRQSNVLVEKLGAAAASCNPQPVNVFPFVCLSGLDIIAESAMGVQVNAQSNPTLGYTNSVKIVIEIISKRLRKPHWRTDTLFKIFAPHVYWRMQKHIQIMKNFTTNVIEQRREHLKLEKECEKNTINTSDDIGAKEHKTLLDTLLTARTVDDKPLSDEDIREEVETFMFAGHDTTTSAISFTLYMISRHSEVQKKLVDEISEVIGDDLDQAVGYDQLRDLRFLECVIKESMRLYPPVPIIGRYFEKDSNLDGLTIPAKCHLNIPLFIVLRDPDNFKDPNEFRPERFASDSLEIAHSYIYIPFSSGPRDCIGKRYGMLEMKSVISKILRHFELLPQGDEVVPLLGLILRSKTGMQMGLKPRQERLAKKEK